MERFPLRRSEWVLLIYFAYITAWGFVLPLPAFMRLRLVLANAGIAVLLFLLSRPGGLIRSVLRDWVPAALIIMAYREVGWLALPHPGTELEQRWVQWDRLVLHHWGVKAAIESLGALLPAILEISYLLVYTTIPLGLALIYLARKRELVEQYLTPVLVAVLGTYALFPFFPSEPPRTVFPGEMFPSYPSVLRRFNWWLLEGYGIHTGVFPSAHVSGAFSAAFALRRILPDHRQAGRFLLALAVLIAVATVYCRYHYLVDALAGFAIAWFVFRSRQWLS